MDITLDLEAPATGRTAEDRDDLPSRRRWSPWWAVPVGPFAGALVGVVARGWMRLLTDDPEFTWSGTIFIVLAFTLTGLGHGVAWAARRAGLRRRATTVARITGGVLTLSLFVGAGGIMLPTVLGASLCRWRAEWPRSARVLMAVIATPLPIMLAVEGWRDGLSPRSVLGLLLLAATYTIVVASMRSIVAPLDDGWRMHRIARVLLVVAGVLLLGLVALLIGGVLTSGT